MASRDIANMHLFLEMKKKFPELPEDIIRKHIIENSDDHEKCLHLLNEEKKNHWCSNPSFADFTLPCHHIGGAESHGGIAYTLKDPNSKSPLDYSIPYQQSQQRGGQFRFSQQHQHRASHISILQASNGRSVSSHAGNVQFPFKPLRVPNTSEVDQVQSAPVVSSNKQPFSVIYKNSASSHYTGFQFNPNDNSVHSDKEKVTFSRAEEHVSTPDLRTGACGTSNAKSQLISENPPLKRHTVKLSITPSFPYQFQYGDGDKLNSARASSGSSRHTTSVNLQLRPPSADQYPIAVTTTPIGKRSDNDNFDSHVQISVSSTGATFTARRLQKSSVSQFHPRMMAVSGTHQNSVQHPNRPNVLNIHPRLSSQYMSGRNYFSPESRFQRHPASHMRPSPESVGLSVVPEIPQDRELPKLKPDWLHFLPSPNRLEIYQPAFQVTASMYPSHVVPKSSLHQEIISPSDEKYKKQAILNHQRDRMEMLLEELKNVREVCFQLRAEVTVMEKEIKEVNVPSPEEVQELKEEIKKLRLECSCLLIEVDFSNTKQVPLGVTDEDFYSNIFTGPVGPIPPVGESNAGPQAAGGSSETLVPDVQTSSTLSPCDEDDDERAKWKCSACTWLNHPALKICETCFMKRKSDIQQQAGTSEHSAEDDEDERNKWMCKYCTYLNHPALEICESCDQSRRTGVFGSHKNCSGTDSGLVHHPESRAGTWPRRTAGSVQISVTQNVPSSSKGLKLQLTHTVHR